MYFPTRLVGYNLGPTLEAIESVNALEMAISTCQKVPLDLIHHSDRGVQYCCTKYVKLLQDNNIKISMTENGDPLENAVAERINGIIKDEYLECYEIEDIVQAKLLLASVIELYNEERPHNSIENYTPKEVHEKNIKTKRLWKSYYKKKERKEVEVIEN